MAKRATGFVGVISDTHGLLRPEALAALRGATHILHAGDIGNDEVLEGLRALAPVIAVRGNTDAGAWATRLPETTLVVLAGARLYLLHDAQRLSFDPAEDGLHAVISGHSHIPRNERRDGVLHFNPGSAGPRRFDRPVALGRLYVGPRGVRGEIVTLLRP